MRLVDQDGGNGVCYVISPIGDEGTAERRYADRILRFIIEPAMNECGLKPERSDKVPEPGKISERMFSGILEAELCVAVLTDARGLHNPNVFYELAIAHAAARPVILLMARGKAVPFDIADFRFVEYDINDVEGLVDGDYAKQIVEHVKGLKSSVSAGVPFRPDLPPLGGGADQAMRYFENAEDFGKPEVWMQLLEETEHEFQIMGTDLFFWASNVKTTQKDFKDLLIEKSDNGCHVRMLLMHPHNPSFEHIMAGMKDPLRVYTDRATKAFSFFQALSTDHVNIEVRQIERGCVLSALTLTDRRAIFTPLLFSQRTRYSPVWECETRHPLYAKLREEFEALWSVNDLAGRPPQDVRGSPRHGSAPVAVSQ